MHKLKRLYCSMIFLFFILYASLPLAEQGSREIVKFDNNIITVNDLCFYLRQFHYPFASEIEKFVEEGSQKSPKIVLEKLSDLAFYQLYTAEKLKHRVSETIEFRVREHLWSFAYDEWKKLVKEEINVKDEEIKKYYTEHKREFIRPEQRKVAVIFKAFLEGEKSREKAIRFMENLRKRPDLDKRFTEYARQYSDLGNRREGGIVDYFSRGTYGKTFESVAFSLKEGEISPVFTTRRGAFIVKCLDVKTTETLPEKDVSGKIKRELFEKKFKDRLMAKLAEIKSKAKIKIPGLKGNVLLKVNDFELTSSTLFAVYPELQSQALSSSESFKKILNAIAEKELIYQYMTKHYFSKDTQLARNFKTYKAVHYFNILSDEEARAKITVGEDEIKKFYEEKKDFYHDVTPKKLGVLVFMLPRREEVSENQYYVEYNKMRDRAESFLHLVNKDKKDFVSTAKEFATQYKKVRYYETDYITEFPEDWELSSPIIEFSQGRISPIFLSEKGLAVFKVLETQKPRTLSFEEARDKIFRVLFSNKKREYFDSLKEKTLRAHNYKVLF